MTTTDTLPETYSPAQRRAYRYGFDAGDRGRDLESAFEGTWSSKARRISEAYLDGYTDGTAGFPFGSTPAEKAEASAARIAATIAARH